MLHECNCIVFTYLHDEKSCTENYNRPTTRYRVCIYKRFFQLLLADYILTIHIFVRQSALAYSSAIFYVGGWSLVMPILERQSQS